MRQCNKSINRVIGRHNESNLALNYSLVLDADEEYLRFLANRVRLLCSEAQKTIERTARISATVLNINSFSESERIHRYRFALRTYPFYPIYLPVRVDQ